MIMRLIDVGLIAALAIALPAYAQLDYVDRSTGLQTPEMEAGDTELAEKLSAQGQAMQHKLHQQGFSTAPVDDILAHFEEQVAAAMETVGVTVIVSKWDEESLARHPDAVQVDVTMELVKAMGTNEKQLGFVKQIGDKPPVPLEEIKEHKH